MMVEQYGVSQRRASGLLQMWRSTLRLQVHPRQDDAILAELRRLAGQRPRFGYRRLYVMLRRKGILVNHKRVHRLYRLEGLSLKRKGKKRRRGARVGHLLAATRVNERWSMDFVSDSLADGRQFRTLTIVDDHSRLSPAVEVDTSLAGLRVAAGLSLARLAEIVGTTPQTIQMIESGANREPSVVKGLRIARALGITDSLEIERLFNAAGG